jgi:hypothetical protein
VAAYDKLVDDSFISTNDAAVRKGKQEILAALRKPEGNIHNETDEQPTDIRLAFTNGVTILNFTKHWTDYDKNAGISPIRPREPSPCGYQTKGLGCQRNYLRSFLPPSSRQR